MGLGIFESVYFSVDSSRLAGHTKVGIVAREIPRKEYGGGVGGGQADQLVLQGTLAVLNTFGRGEHYRSTVSISAPGFSEYSAFDAQFRKPLLWAPGPPQAWSAHGRYSRVACEASKFIEMVVRGSASYHYGSLSWTVLHEIQRVAATDGASLANIEQGGWTSKVGVAWQWLQDTRNDPYVASRGSYRKLLLELCGSPSLGSMLHLKTEIAGNVSIPLSSGEGSGPSLTLRGKLGHFFPLNGRPEPGRRNPSVSSVDAFHLGGAHLMPGFETRGIARSDAQESLGSTSFWLTSAHLLFPLPSTPDFIRGHVHASACGVSGILGGKAEQLDFSSMFSGDALRTSVGVGVILGMSGIGRMTLTWSKILSQQANDASSGFIQMGFTTSFD